MLRVFGCASLLALAFVCGCTPPPAAPLGSGAPTLGVQPAGHLKGAQGPVRVTYFAPKGDAEVRAQVSVAFDRPMVALGSNVGAEAALTIVPAIAGRARWVGSHTVVFEPAGPLPGATTFQVRVPKGLRALDGNVLPEELSFQFSDAAPTSGSRRACQWR